jgi:hypothetical protein
MFRGRYSGLVFRAGWLRRSRARFVRGGNRRKGGRVLARSTVLPPLGNCPERVCWRELANFLLRLPVARGLYEANEIRLKARKASKERKELNVVRKEKTATAMY